MKSRYSMLIQWSDEDQCYIVSLPEFGKYARTHGETYEEAIKNAQEVLELLIEDSNNLPQPNIYHSEVCADL
ncbi:MAG: type II toxin-antitoxin system HicB family antitoxin [Xenococcaceae cyanobacterium MO_167.B27]|nr:type II toxin-antitoxin system HicB family antitoxin [Xenococcaceae cyanobacterium MO_167.B27]